MRREGVIFPHAAKPQRNDRPRACHCSHCTSRDGGASRPIQVVETALNVLVTGALVFAASRGSVAAAAYLGAVVLVTLTAPIWGALVAWAWFGDWRIALVIGAAIVINLLAAALSGVLIPLLLRLLKDKQWWLGSLVAAAGFGLQAAALAFGSVLLVQALLVTSLLFALPLSAWWVGRRIEGSFEGLQADFDQVEAVGDLRKIAIDGYIIQTDHSDIKAMTAEIQKIGVNINQIAKAINTDLASSRPLDAARLLHLLIGIDQTLKELKK